MATANIKWSFSSLKTFQQCPKKYYHTKVAKDVSRVRSVESDHGEFPLVGWLVGQLWLCHQGSGSGSHVVVNLG